MSTAVSAAAVEPAVRIDGVTLGYGANAILADVAFKIGVGDFWFFIGPNGSGKTTLVKALLGSLEPRKGVIVKAPAFASTKTIGLVPQRCELTPGLPTTVRELVSLGLVRATRTAEPDASRIEWALEKVGMAGTERRSYWTLSGGQRQRVLVARALVRRPRLLVADEPTSGLDLMARTAFLDTLGELNRSERLTIVFVTHELDLAVRHASHIAMFHGGTVLAGPCEAILNTRVLDDAYGSAALELESLRVLIARERAHGG